MKIETKNFINLNFAKKVEENDGKFKILWRNNKITEIPTKIPFDKDVVWLHGFWTGDRGDNRNFAFANTKFHLIEIIYNILVNKLKLNPRKFTLKINLNREDLKLPEISLGIKVKKTFTKGWKQKSPYYYVLIAGTLTPLLNIFKHVEENLTKYLKSVSRNVRNYWYAGFFDAEGPITSRTIGWNSCKLELNKEVGDLLRFDGYKSVRISEKEIWLGQPSKKLIRNLGRKETEKLCKSDLIKFSKEILPFAKNEDYKKRSLEYINGTHLTEEYRKFLELIKKELVNKKFSISEFENSFKTKNGSYILPTLVKAGLLSRGKIGNKFLYWLPTPEDPAREHRYPSSTKPCEPIG